MSDHDQTTPEKVPAFEKWQVEFLRWLARKGNISAACRKAKIDRKWAYKKRDSDPFFKEAWDEALEVATEALEEEARRRAAEGVLEPVFYEGKRIAHVRKYSDTMLIFLLKAHKPNKYRENHRHELVIPPVNIQHDFSKLTVDELKLLRELRAKMEAGKETEDAGTP